MVRSNFFVLFIALLFTLTLLPMSVGALTYRSDLNNGSWSGFVPYSQVSNGTFETGNFTDFTAYTGSNKTFAVVGGSLLSGGSYLGSISLGSGNSTTDAILCTSKSIFENGKSYEVSFDYNASGGEYSCGAVYSSLGSFTCGSADTSSRVSLFYTSSSVSTNNKVVTLTNSSGSSQPLCFILRKEGGSSTKNILLDGIKVNGLSLTFDSTYFKSDTEKSVYNRDLVSDVNINPSTLDVEICDDGFCGKVTANDSGGLDSNISLSSDYLLNGERAFYIRKSAGGGSESILLYSEDEKLGDADVNFYYRGLSAGYIASFSYGYMNDSNVYTAVGSYNSGNPANDTGWISFSYKVPSGNNRLAMSFSTLYAVSQGYSVNHYISNLNIKRNNIGTFFKGSSAPSCSSISSCSNVTSASDLKSNETRDLYWVVDYVSGATCNVYEDGVFQGNMYDLGTGMYYYKIDSKAFPSNDVNVSLSASCSKVPYATKSFITDVQIFNDSNIQTSMSVGNTLTNNVGYRGDLVTFYSVYEDDLGSLITDGTCTLTIDASTNAMSYNSSTGRYEYLKGFISDDTYYTTHACSKSNYVSQNSSYNVLIGTPLVENVTFVPIQNSFDYNLFDGNVTINNSFSGGDIIFSLVGLESGSAKIVWSNAKDSKQYFIYTSSDGNTWVFSDTLTFGATNSTPVQKIWNASTRKFDYSVVVNVSSTKVYFKFVYQAPAYYREVINSSSDWVNQNPASNYFISSGKNFDVFSDSNYSNIQTYTTTKYQNLVSGDMNVGYELQFTAYGTSAGTLLVGARPLTGADSVSSVAVTTSPTRFSIPIAPASRDAKLLIKSTSATTNTYYITDYAIVPRSYFVGQLEVKNPDYTNLQAILHNDGAGNLVSYIYIKEGQPARLQTSFYDTSGDLDKVEVQILINSTLVKTQFINISSSAGNFVNFNQLVDGVIDLNGLGGELDSTKPLRILTYKTILWNDSGLAVSEQSNTIAILQFPYFPNDFKLTLGVPFAKLGTNPVVDITIKNAVPKNLLGLKFSFYNSFNDIDTPNYSEVIYAKDLGCTTLSSCTKEITFDGSKQSKGFVWDTLGEYTVQVSALLSTENPNYTDSYTNTTKKVQVTASGYQLLQMIQYMERHQNATNHTPYNSTEKIPLMLGVIDDAKKDLSNTITPYFTLTVNGTPQTTAFYPDAFRFDESSGTNIWLFNQYLYDDAGALLDQNDVVQFSGKIVDLKLTQSTDSNFGFANRCTLYPVDIVGNYVGAIADAWNGSIGADIFNWKMDKDSNTLASQLTNLFGSFAGSLLLNGCVAYPDNVVRSGSAFDTNITIDDTFPVYNYADNRQALYCGQKVDNNSVIDKMGEEFGCVLLIHQDLQQIDGVKFQIGNDNSDYSVTNENKQYLDFTITDTDIMFSDTQALLQGWFHKGYFGASPTGSPTVKDFVYSVWKSRQPNLTNDQIASQYKFTELLGGGTRQINDVNTAYGFKTDFNNNVYNKAIFFKVSGLSVINAYDYLTNEQRNSFNTSNFLSYARENNLPIYPKKMTITLYNNSDSKPMKIIESTSPLIINYAPSVKQQVMDKNGTVTLTNLPQVLPLKLISTMYSANSTISSRLIANLQFLQIIKSNPNALNGGGNTAGDIIGGIADAINYVLVGVDDKGNKVGILNNPLGFIANPLNITLMILFVGFVLIVTLMIKNVAPVIGK